LFEVNTLGAKRNCVIQGPDPTTARGRELRKILRTVDPLHISRLAEARDLKFGVLIEGWGPETKLWKSRSYKGRD